LIAYDVCGVQPMTGPTGLIFAIRPTYSTQSGTDAQFNEANSAFTGQGSATIPGGSRSEAGNNFSNIAWGANQTDSEFGYGTGMSTAGGEQLGDGTYSFNEMAFAIDKVTATAKTRALKAEYTTELAQDLRAIHGADAESELANILSQEILTEINREVIRTIYDSAKRGCETGTTTPYVFDMDTDASGRWSVEKFKGLMFQLEREANIIARKTRRGKGNIIIASADVASALSMTGMLDTGGNTALGGGNVDPSTSTFVGMVNGKKLYIDPYYTTPTTGYEYAVVGYRGPASYDAGLFYCPYVPLQMVRALGENSFQPKIAFKTRYAMVANPFVHASGTISTFSNDYYRRFQVRNVL
jgi:hypothetical protein